VASHDLLHVLTDYERDEPGELLLIAFTHAFAPQRVLPIGFALGLLGAPASRLPAFLRDALRAWCRGRRARIRCSTPWEQLLRLPTAEARVLLGIADTAHAHRGRIWRRISDGGPWARVPIVEGRRVTDRNPAPARRCSTATWEPTSPSSPPSR
jgi:hypothetical protein